jgi:hypothetical protein
MSKKVQWDEVKIEDSNPITIERVVGKRTYDLTYRDINGDTYERVVYEARAKGEGFEKDLTRKLREHLIVSIAGAPYDKPNRAKMDREMPVWMKEDIEKFLASYILGNL